MKYWKFSFLTVGLFVFLFMTGCVEHEEILAPASKEMEYQSKAISGDRYLIGFMDTPRPDIVNAAGGEVYKTFTIVPAVAAHLSEQAADALSQNPHVRFVEPDHPVFAQDQKVPWGIDRVFGDEEYNFPTWKISTGAGIGVAILDTGIDEEHEDLNVAEIGITTIDDTHWGHDVNGHGTHVAGSVAALDNNVGVVGVAPAVLLYAVKVLNEDGVGAVSTTVAGIEWAVEQNIPIINMSLGNRNYSELMHKACDAAYAAGHLVVSSAGNEGNPGGGGDNVTYPASFESVIAVANSDSDDNRSRLSSTGSAVELIAPGSSILSTLPENNYGHKGGTSMASPHVAGAAALAWAVNPDLTNVQIREILQNTAEDLGLRSNHQGYGLVRADLAVAAVSGLEPPATGNIEGTVKGEESAAIEGATVLIEGIGLSATTDVNGDYLLENVPAGDRDVTASADGYYSETVTVTVEEDVTVTWNFTLAAIPPVPTYTVSGTVTDTEGDALADATVTIEETNHTTTTGSDGTYSISDVEEGTYHITASKDGYGSETTSVTINNNTTVDFVLEEKTEELPVIQEFELTDTSNPSWVRVAVEWVVSGSNLATVKSEMFLGEKLVDSKISSVSGDQASGTHELRNRKGNDNTYKVTLAVTDADGNIATDTKSVFGTTQETGTVTDIDGIVYQTVKIDDQWWMAENLKVTRYNDGTYIDYPVDNTDWMNRTTGAYAIYPHSAVNGIDSDKEMVDAYGKLYNWYAVDDDRGLCPEGWGVPSDEEWTKLGDYLGGDSVAGAKLKSTRTHPDPHPRWDKHLGIISTNESGFSGLPGSQRMYDGEFGTEPGYHASMWTSTKEDPDSEFAWSRFLTKNSDELKPYIGSRKGSGRSVRCIMYEE